MSTTQTTNLNKLLKEYAEKNETKKILVNECKGLSTNIKNAMIAENLDIYEVKGIKATITYKVRKTLDLEKVEKLLGYKIPAECYILNEEAALNVKC